MDTTTNIIHIGILLVLCYHLNTHIINCVPAADTAVTAITELLQGQSLSRQPPLSPSFILPQCPFLSPQSS